MSELLNIISGLLIILGAIAILVGLLGVYRMPDFYTRLHAASVIDTMGVILILSGLILYSGINLVSVKLALIMLFVVVTTPTASHALAKSALHGKLQPVLDGDEQK